jgi:hypothetical protein
VKEIVTATETGIANVRETGTAIEIASGSVKWSGRETATTSAIATGIEIVNANTDLSTSMTTILSSR